MEFVCNMVQASPLLIWATHSVFHAFCLAYGFNIASTHLSQKAWTLVCEVQPKIEVIATVLYNKKSYGSWIWNILIETDRRNSTSPFSVQTLVILIKKNSKSKLPCLSNNIDNLKKAESLSNALELDFIARHFGFIYGKNKLVISRGCCHWRSHHRRD